MAGTWPNLDAEDLEARVRTYLNEVTASFYTQAEIWRWLSIAAKDIAQKSLCVRRVLDAVTVTSTRNVATNCYKVLHVEYVPTSGREIMLVKIDPLRVGNYPLNGTAPQYWYEFGGSIGIDPVPDGVYKLRLYVADIPKLQHSTYPITTWNSGWTGSGTGSFSNSSTNVYTGTTGQAGVDTYGTSIVTATTYTLRLTLSSISNCGLVVKAGTTASPTLNTPGSHTVTLVSNGSTLSLHATMTGASGGLTIDDLYILKEADFSAAADQIELAPVWQHLLAVYATYGGLMKDRKTGPAAMLESIYENELNYLKQHVVEVIPDGRNSLKFQ
jgi:hypothetical protein